MKKLLTILLLLITVDATAQWIQQTSGTNSPIRDVEFINRNTGWACGELNILKTTDGGNTWLSQPNPATGRIQQIFPVDSNVVYAAGWFNNILKTTNGGTNWVKLETGFPNGYSYEGLYFINENMGWICGSLRILYTTDGGSSFVNVPISADFYDIKFSNSEIGIASGLFGDVFRTTNGGMSWYRIDVIINTGLYSFHRMSFIDENTGWMAGGSQSVGGVYKTTNFGATWDSIGRIFSGSNQIYTVEFSSENIGYAGGEQGRLFKTIDGGVNWIEQQVSQYGNSFFESIYAYDDTIVWAVGNIGKILFTNTGGDTTLSISSNNLHIPESFSLHQNFPNPFNPSTNISFDIPNTSHVKLTIYDALGREVSTLVNETLYAGSYNYHWTIANVQLGSGIYFYRLSTGEFSDTKRMLLVK